VDSPKLTIIAFIIISSNSDVGCNLLIFSVKTKIEKMSKIILE